jgi:UDP-glucose 4-epimerase
MPRRHARDERIRPDAVCHHAAQLDVRASLEDPVYDANINVLGGLNVLLSAQRAGAQRFIFSSTGGAIYGEPTQMPVPETAPQMPESPYGLSKATFENYLRLWGRQFEIVPVVLRYSNVYGPRQGAGGEAGVVAIFAGRLLDEKPCTIFGDGTSARDYVYVGDVVRANVSALTRGDGDVVNIGTGSLTSITDVYRTIRESVGRVRGKAIDAEPQFVPLRPGEVHRICLDASRAKEVLNWEPQTSFETGVDETVKWISEHPEARV